MQHILFLEDYFSGMDAQLVELRTDDTFEQGRFSAATFSHDPHDFSPGERKLNSGNSWICLIRVENGQVMNLQDHFFLFYLHYDSPMSHLCTAAEIPSPNKLNAVTV